jgi:hypothetical protein
VAAAAASIGDAAAAAVDVRFIAAGVAARYPRRARTLTPGRFTRTEIEWNRPSSLPFE